MPHWHWHAARCCEPTTSPSCPVHNTETTQTRHQQQNIHTTSQSNCRHGRAMLSPRHGPVATLVRGTIQKQKTENRMYNQTTRNVKQWSLLRIASMNISQNFSNDHNRKSSASLQQHQHRQPMHAGSCANRAQITKSSKKHQDEKCMYIAARDT